MPTTRRYRWILAAILGLALLVRLLLWGLPAHLPANDEVEYLAVARDLLAGRGWRFYDAYPWLRAPLYPLVLAGWLWLTGGNTQLALLPQIALSVGQIFGLWLLGRQVASRSERAEQAGLWTAALGALLLTLATFANLWMAETLWNTLWTAALVVLLRWWRTPRWQLAAVAGMLIGLACLTRSVPLLFVPILLIWMAWRVRGRASLLHALVLAATCALMIAPWTIRNWRAYDSPILIETGFAYNLWAFSEPPLDLGTINDRLAAIPNPAERSAYASAQGMALLRADPTIVLRKIPTNMIYLWRVKPIEDRFIQANYYSDVPLSYFGAALLFDDGLYLLLLLLAAWGIGRARHDGRLALLLLWLAYVVATTALTHGEARYRHFIWPVLLAYAGATFGRAGVTSPRWARGTALAVGAGLAALLLWFYPWRWASDSVTRGWIEWRAERALAAGADTQAIGLYERAVAVQPTPDAWLKLGYAHRQQGDLNRALVAFRAAFNDKRDYPPAVLALGETLIADDQPDSARDVWRDSAVDQPTLLMWAWAYGTRSAATQIDVGAGLEYGFVRGMHPAEELNGATARWSEAHAQLRLAGGDAQVLLLRLSNPRPPDAPAANAHLCIDELGCVPLDLGAEWRVIMVPLPAHAGEWLINLDSTPWTSPDDQRTLGIVVDWAQVTALTRR